MSQDNEKMNLIFMGNIQYPHGMAAAKRIGNWIDYLKLDERLDIKVLVLRQGRVRLADNKPAGTYRGVDYVTVGSDIRPGITALFKAPGYYLKAMAFLRNNRQKNGRNVLYIYGYPNIYNLPLIIFARMLKFRVIFDIVEDIAFQGSAPDIMARMKNFSARWLFRRLGLFADAVIVISQRLYEKTAAVANGRFEVALLPISVNFEQFNYPPKEPGQRVRIFYGGTFAEKDGVENLICAFEKVCDRRDNVVLTLSGKGSKVRMEKILEIISNSQYRERIEYMGYLEDDEYYALLGECDILCMTRVASKFAQAGFPFKLGEYLATGRAVIASNVGDVGLYLDDRKNAVIVEPGSSESITKALEFLISNPAQAQKIGQEGRKLAKEKFNAKTLTLKLKKVLKRT